MADYQARINLLVAGQDSLSRIQRQVEDLEGAITAVERRWRTASAALTRSRTVLGVTGTDLPRGAGGRFAQDPDRQQRINALAAQRQAAIQERIARLTASRTRQEIDNVNTRLAAQERLNRRVENQIALESRLNAAVDLYRTNLRKFERGGSGKQDPALVRNAEAIQEAFAAFEAGGSRNLDLVRSLATELGRVGEAQRELNRAQSLGSKGFEAGRRLQERLSVVAQAGTTSPERVRAARSMATEAISASRSGDQQAYTEAIRRATAATSRLERESRETATALQAQQVEAARAAAATAQLRAAESAASVAARDKLAAAAQARQERATFLAGAPVSQFPIGPAQASTRRRFSGDTSVERAEGALRTKELETQRALNVKFFAEEKAQVLELDRLRAASAQKQTQRIQGIGKAVQGSLSSAAIGGAFPLLFGQSPQAAVGGAIGGLLGGAGGGFAGSLLGTALGELEAAKARTKELAVELGLTSTQAKTLATAFELAGRNSQQLEAAVTNIQGLGLSTKETASAIKIAVELSKEYGGSVEKIAQSFADTLESGKVSITTLNKFTAQGIPIQDELAKKFGVSRTKLLEMAKDGEISVQQLTDALVKMGREAEATADKGETGFDRFTRAVTDISTAIASAAGALLKILIPALDTVLTKLSAVINRATQAINLITNAQVGEASSALFRSGATRGILGGFAQSKGTIDDLTGGLKTLNPLLATNKEQLDTIAAVAQRYRTELSKFGGSVGEYATGTAQVELSRVQRDIAARATALKIDTQTPTTTEITNIDTPTNLPPSGTGSSGRKGAQPPEDRTAQLKKEFTALVAIGQAEDKIRDLLFQGRDLLAAQAELDKQIDDIERDRNEALMRANYESERIVINKIAEARVVKAQFEMEDKQREIRQRRFEQELQIQEAVRSSVQSFTDMRKEQELQLQYGKTYSRLLMEGMLPAEAERIANFDKLIAGKLKENEIETAIVTLAIEKAKQEGHATVELEKRLKLLGLVKTAITGEAAAGPGAGPTNQERLQSEADRVRGELNTLVDPINMITTAAAGIGDAFATSFKSVIDGSMTAKQALGSFFKSVADMFLDMAAQMIAAWIKMAILNTVVKIFGGAAGGGLSSGFNAGSASALPTDAGGWATSFNTPLKFAEGGFVTGPTSAIIGEGGESEYVIPANKMQSAMSRYSRGARGESVIAGNGGGTEGGTATAAAGPMVVDVRYSVERINSVDYVTAAQFQSGMQQAAQQGAQQGEQRTLRRLQNAPSARKRIGI